MRTNQMFLRMRNFLTLLIFAAAAAVVGCGGGTSGRQKKDAAARPVEPKFYTYRVVAEYPHGVDSYTQGLQFVDGQMWEGTGQHGESRLQKITDLGTGATEVLAELPQSEFGEGITVLGDRIYQLTWTSNTAHVYDLSGRLLKNIRYSGEGWGLTTDGQMLYMSNGSSRIFRLDPETFSRKSAITVTLRGGPVNYLNELEWIDGKIWANVYTLDQIVIIDPATGIVEGVVDLRGLLPESERTPSTDVLNGIAYDPRTGRIFVTGKNWSKIFEIEIFEK